MLVKSCNMILDTIYRGLQMKRNCLFYGEQLQFFLAAFWSEEFVSLVDEIGFEELILNMKISMLNCQTKKRLMRFSKESCI